MTIILTVKELKDKGLWYPIICKVKGLDEYKLCLWEDTEQIQFTEEEWCKMNGEEYVVKENEGIEYWQNLLNNQGEN